ncbi:MAG: insulinase family protein [Agathobaculum sp.]|uniref:EF-P 5-aminopentanol modification-associated protein YfmH n=1 Tax=Agathobaculum sp. TaxID=2048138 RepID=UPI0025BD1465|nr:pitrilysin family protein [Agathobaculum sp.]MCI7124881.1 insulinase family protein [Agathobaculum sp.]MDY3711466.1 pitrilysin family protein [Agathobaculum sp.]
MNKHYPALNERVQSRTLDNGLRICYIPKEGFGKTFAILATDYGSVDTSFTIDGTRYDTPAGVAHFLEHKMFEDKDGNALQKFAATGASPNAFTSQTMTAYHFSCTDRFMENLTILLQFVFTPYFTEENVAKERGIIGQEIGMMEDTPGWQAFTGLFEGLFRTHPVRVSIAGSVDSIAQITPNTLYACHRAFYSPRNMVLVVCGTADFDEVCHLAAQYSPQDAPAVGRRDYGTRRDTVNAPLVTRGMQVSQPQFLLGFKDAPRGADESRLRRQLTGELAVRILCGDTAPLYARLYEKRLIGRDFDTDYTLIPEGAAAILGGESRDPAAAREEIEREVAHLAREGVDKALFDRMKKALYGLHLRALDSPEGYARRQATAVFAGEDYPDFAAQLETVDPDDVQAMFARWAQGERSSMSVVTPRQQ